jgi:YidC/Oxa1 family membrane protein insertase
MQKHIYIFLLLFLVMLFSHLAYPEVKGLKIEVKNINAIIADEVKDPFAYSGLATFYNAVTAYVVDEHDIEKLDNDYLYTLNPNQFLAIVGHYNILITTNINGTVSFANNKLIWHEKADEQKIQAQLLLKSDINQLPQLFQQLRYAHLWEPLRQISIGLEAILLWLYSIHDFGWGITIIFFSLFFKILVFPANLFLTCSQRKVSHIHARLEPKLADIKANFSGQEAHEKFLAAHKAQGVTPFYTLKPLLPVLIPVPFLIATFNVLGELDFLAGHSFLWIKDLVHPDSVFDFGMHIQLLGNTLNSLPILMTLLTIAAALLHQNKIVSAKELRKQKLNLYVMAFVVLLVFYPFPSVMVLYWTFAILWQLIQQRVIPL